MKYREDFPGLLEVFKQHLADGWSSTSFAGKLVNGGAAWSRLMDNKEWLAVKNEHVSKKKSLKAEDYHLRNSPPADRRLLEYMEAHKYDRRDSMLAYGRTVRKQKLGY